jgi:hypothetical protein
MGKAVAVTAQKVSPCPMQLHNAPLTGDAVSHPRADEIGPHTAELACDVGNADSLGNILPFAITYSHSVSEVQPVILGPQIDRGDILAIAYPLPAASRARTKASCFVHFVHVD